MGRASEEPLELVGKAEGHLVSVGCLLDASMGHNFAEHPLVAFVNLCP